MPNSSELAPGPGEYQPHYQSTKTLAPTYSMGTKIDQAFEVKSHNPGPAHYSASQEFTKPKSPAYSMRPQTSPPKKFDVPGPGAYQANSANVSAKAPVYSMGGRTLPSFFGKPVRFEFLLIVFQIPLLIDPYEQSRTCVFYIIRYFFIKYGRTRS